MSDVRIAELERENATLRAEAKQRRLKSKAQADDLAALTQRAEAAERDRESFKVKAEATPTELQGKLDELTGQLRQRDHRDAWRAALDGSLADKATVEDVWAKLGYDPAKLDAVPAPEQVLERVKAGRESAPYLFKPAADAATSGPGGPTPATATVATPPPPGSGRGAPGNPSAKFKVTRDNLRDGRWMMQNGESYNKAAAEGLVELVG